jgi:hypothetical protein
LGSPGCAAELLEPLLLSLTFDHEVDAARWVSPAEAEALLTYPRDLEVLGAVCASHG